MKKASFMISFLIIFLIGCNSTQIAETEVVEEKQSERSIQVEENNEDESEQQMDRLDEPVKEAEEIVQNEQEEGPKQGDYQIYLGGIVTETDDKIIIEGESNLIPGSRVFGEVSVGKSVTYFLKPQVEDYDFVITFTPSSHTQWNEIVEAYGQKGQKLVGNLVVQDKYSDRQYIEKVIPYEHDESEQESINHQNDEETLDEETSDDE